MNSRQISIISIMSSLAIGGSYALSMVPNVEITTFVFFIVTCVFGTYVGIICMITTSLIYGMFNPWGIFIPQIWVSQVLGWMFTILIGASIDNEKNHGNIFYSMCGAICTIFFDMMTNFGYSIIFDISYVDAIIFGIPFTFMHTLSNIILFGAASPLIIKISNNILNKSIEKENNVDGTKFQYI